MRIEVSVNRGAVEEEISTLLKLATSQANEKDYESAIASLRRAYALMESASTEWPMKTYFRLARYLHLLGDFEGSISWLQQLLNGLDAHCDAREQLYKQWGWMQSGGKPATIPKSLRSNMKREIKEEITLFKGREKKIQERLKKKAAAEKAASKKASAKRKVKQTSSAKPESTIASHIDSTRDEVLNASDVTPVLVNFSQRCFMGEDSSSVLDLSAATFVFERLSTGPVTVQEAHALPPKYKSVLRELLTQYIMFLEMNRDLPFPPDFLTGCSADQLGGELLAYICEHQWPFPQMLDSR